MHTFAGQETIYCFKFRNIYFPETTGIKDM